MRRKTTQPQEQELALPTEEMTEVQSLGGISAMTNGNLRAPGALTLCTPVGLQGATVMPCMDDAQSLPELRRS